MSPQHRQQDEEQCVGLANGASSPPPPSTPYRDSPSDSDVDETIGPAAGAPLRRRSEFDGRGRAPRPTWRHHVSEHVPVRWRHAWTATATWVQGPQRPRIYKITPVFPKVQHAPINLLDRYAPQRIHRFCLLVALYACWLVVFSLMLGRSAFAAEVPGHGTPVRLSCAARYWIDKNGCGLNGDQCRPFASESMAFRCPADCHKTQILTPHAVGDREVVYQPLVVGGPSDQKTGYGDQLVENAVYRGDSFICASAVHSGFTPDNEGGCGVVASTGEQASFPSSKRNGIESTAFDSYFPLSIGFLKGTRAQCKDLRWPTLVPSVIFTVLLSLFTTDPGVHFWSLFVALFFHVALVSDPPANTTYYDLVSIALGRFLPACFCAWVTYKYTVKQSLSGLTAQIEKTVLWLGAAWVGSLNNYTFDQIPIQRLTPHDLKAQPGAVPALIIVVLSIFFIALGQAWAFRVEGRMPRYLVIYGLFVAALLICLTIPGLDLRIHHYILALLLVPGTSFQNRPSLLYQGLLIGLFINGVARWGFASILETPASLLQGSPGGTLLPIVSVLAIGAKNITFGLGSLPTFDRKANIRYDGISVLVNDVERFRGYGDEPSYWDHNVDWQPGQNLTWTWTRHEPRTRLSGSAIHDSDDLDALASNLPEYFRFGYMSGSWPGDYSKAGKWDSDGQWIPMAAGPSLMHHDEI